MPQSSYQLALRGAVRGLWSGAVDFYGAFDMVFTAIDRNLADAWKEGAAECGIKPEEYSPEERIALAQAINSEKNHVNGLLTFVEQNSKAGGGKLDTAFGRLNTWTNRYKDLVNEAKAMACADEKLRWTLGAAEHCSSCLKLSGKIKRGSYWQSHVMPQNPPNGLLECGGWNCACTLQPTEDRASPGPLPRLP